MPEGGEVRGFVDSINQFLGSAGIIEGIAVNSGRYLRSPIQGLDGLAFPLAVETVGCKGKFIYFTFFNSDAVIFSTLGMSGSWSNRQGKHTRVTLKTHRGDLFFRDPRNFGTLKVSDRACLKAKLEALGPDMLSDGVTPETFIGRLRKCPEKTLAEVLMNQGIVSGVGNYLKADSLWLARLSPHRKVSQCTDVQLRELCLSVRSVITTAYTNGGSTILTYKGFDEKEGGHEMLVYGRKTDPNGELVIVQETRDGRTTWWAPSVQL